MAIKVRRGTDADRLTVTLAQGEIAYTTDTKKFYVGDGTTVGGNEVGGGGGSSSWGSITGTLSSQTDLQTALNAKVPTTRTLTINGTTFDLSADRSWTISGGSGSGIVRIVNSISTPTTAPAAATTDYVYFISGTTTLTLPTAVGNTNRYTLKNVGTNTVTINTTSSQTIDGSTSITMAVRYTALDLVSDGANWNII